MKKMLCFMVVTALIAVNGIFGILPSAEEKNLLVNGDFSEELEGWSARISDDMNMAVNEDFAATLDDTTEGGELSQYIKIEPEAVYKLSFRMKNSVADVAELSKSLYYVKDENGKYKASSEENDGRFKLTASESAKFPCTFGDETENPVWKTYETTISVPSKDINALRIILTFAADEAFAIDDICLEKCADIYGTVVNSGFEAKGADGGAAGWEMQDFVTETDATGNHYAKIEDVTNAGSATVNSRPRIAQVIYAKPGHTLRFAFKLKSSMAEAMVLSYQIFDSTVAETNANMQSVQNQVSVHSFQFGKALAVGAESEWQTYTIDIPVPDGGVDAEPTLVRFRLEAIAKDTEICIDDVSVSYIKDYAEYMMNGDFEMEIPEKPDSGNAHKNGWQVNAKFGGKRVAEDNGNHYIEMVSTGTTNEWIRKYYALAPGRYKLSFRMKRPETTVNSPSVSLQHANITLGNNAGFLNGAIGERGGITIPIEKANTWETKTIYFSVNEAYSQKYLSLPADWTAQGTFYLDDFSLTEDKESFAFLETVSSARYDDASFFRLESGYSEPVTSIAAAKETGRTTIPVTWHYVPENTGVSENLTLAVMVYEKDADNRKRLISFSVVNEKTDISDAAQNGKNGLGVSTLYTSVPIPENASEAHTIEVLRWKGVDSLGLTPYANKAKLAFN